ncbi:uncharacterized protein [Chamaea fasciata]|uniref:uncharacterized protein n=1 Tax=Chamaea fasciata TaxID=190680 RepID=UPI003369D327
MRRGRGAGLAALAAVLLVAVARAQVQQEPSLETTEGSGINISCSHPEIQTNDYIHWYRQLPGRGPERFVSTLRGSKELPDGSGHLLVSADRRSSALWLRRPGRGDAAVYYCALVPRAEEPGLRPGTNRRGRGRAGPGAQRRPRPAGGAAAPPAGPRAAPQLLPLPRARPHRQRHRHGQGHRHRQQNRHRQLQLRVTDCSQPLFSGRAAEILTAANSPTRPQLHERTDKWPWSEPRYSRRHFWRPPRAAASPSSAHTPISGPAIGSISTVSSRAKALNSWRSLLKGPRTCKPLKGICRCRQIGVQARCG